MLDLKKPVEWVGQNGTVRPARVLATDLKGGSFPVLAAIMSQDTQSESLLTFKADGTTTYGDHLRNTKEKYVRYMNIWVENFRMCQNTYITEADATQQARNIERVWPGSMRKIAHKIEVELD